MVDLVFFFFSFFLKPFFSISLLISLLGFVDTLVFWFNKNYTRYGIMTCLALCYVAFWSYLYL